jgi:hypothetical protein
MTPDDGERQPEELENSPEDFSYIPQQSRTIVLSSKDKWRLIRPLLGKFMLPLCKLAFVLFWVARLDI